MQTVPLQLKRNQDSRLRFGHCWVYSNEIDTQVTPFNALQPGQPVEIFNDKKKWMGSGYVNPHSLICARIVSRDRKHPFSPSLLVHRLKVALSLRERLYPKPYYRLVFGESDGLPGLVIDRFGDNLVIQITTAGMEQMKQDVIAAAMKVLRPTAIYLRNDVAIRSLEGLELYTEDVLGTWPEVIEIEEFSTRFQIPSSGGQKTGWFYDQAFNRQRMTPYVKGARVLDVCSYIGAWGVQAAVHGAEDVFCVDASEKALDAVAQNAALNGVESKVATVQGDAFDALRELRAAGERFDVVLLDPPAFIKRKKDQKAGEQAYRKLNQLGLPLLSKDGILITSSCSHHMSEDRLLQVVQKAARHTDRSVQLLERGFQAPDHPVHGAMPETAYLKSLTFRVLPSF